MVLNGLCDPPFEPLGQVEQKYPALKLVFLLAITSAKRVGELQAFSSEDPYITFLPDRVLLRFLPTFLPKVPTLKNINQVISLPAFYPNPASEEEERLHTLDVLRCLRIYLERTRSFRKSENLFLQYSGRNKGCEASKATLSRWIKEAISLSFVAQGRDLPTLHTRPKLWPRLGLREALFPWSRSVVLPLGVLSLPLTDIIGDRYI